MLAAPNAAARVIAKLGGTRAAATLLGLPPSTIQSWKTSGFIPARRQGDLIRATEGRETAITPADFFTTSTPTPAASPA